MALANRSKEYTTTTGLSDYTLDGAVYSYQSLETGLEAENGLPSPAVWTDVPYTCVQTDAAGTILNIEIGRGTVTAGSFATRGTLTRDTIIHSSNAGAKVNWPAGTKTIVVAPQGKDSVGTKASWRVGKKGTKQTGLAGNTWHKVTWVWGDPWVRLVKAEYSAANDTITILRSGDYMVGFNIIVDVDSASREISTAIYVNGSITGTLKAARSATALADEQQQGTARQLTLNAGDVLSCYMRMESGAETVDIWTTEGIDELTSINHVHPCQFWGYEI